MSVCVCACVCVGEREPCASVNENPSVFCFLWWMLSAGQRLLALVVAVNSGQLEV